MKNPTPEEIKELLEIPELQTSIEFEEDNGIVAIIKHALERQYIMGGIDTLNDTL